MALNNTPPLPQLPLSDRGEGWPAQFARLILPETDSTMAEAARRAPDMAGPTWILAHRQRAGRARRGRTWRDPAGNFAATLAMRASGPLQTRSLYSFVAALALFDALVGATGRADMFALKWPNDVLLNGRKLAGILLESGARDYLAIGFGVNLQAAPSREEIEARALPPTCLRTETGCDLLPEAFLDLLAPAFADWQARFATFGFAPLREVWLTRAYRLGEMMTARLGYATYRGRFETLDEQGALVLNTPQGRRAIAAGEVFFD